VAVLSAGLVLHRRGPAGLEVLVAHMGGPFWARKDEGAWSFPKGVVEPGEEPLDAALREVAEELGVPAPPGPYVPLGEVRQSGKVIVAWAVAADLDPADVVPGTFEMEWPPRSGRTQAFPEVDRVAWVSPQEATRLLVKAQRGLVPRVLDVAGGA
jgi:predicted NUDIX family NTP pyrophosphohydrolase